MSWFWFALATPVLYCAAIYIDKFVLSKKNTDPLVVTLLSGVVLGAMALIVRMVFGVNQIGGPEILALLVSGVFLLFYILPYLQALQIDEATRVVPLMQLAPIYVLVFSTVFLGEPLTGMQLVGFGLILASSLVLSTDNLSLNTFKLRRSFWLMTVAMLMYAGIGLLFRYVVREQDFWTTVFYQYLGAFLAAIPLGVYMWQKPNSKKNMVRHFPVLNFIMLSNVIAGAAILVQSLALSMTTAPRVYIVEGSQPLIMLVIAVASSIWFPKIMKEDLAGETLGKKVFFSILIFIGLLFIRN